MKSKMKIWTYEKYNENMKSAITQLYKVQCSVDEIEKIQIDKVQCPVNEIWKEGEE